MIYYQDEEVTIRNMEEADGPVFVAELTAQGWHPDIATYQMRMKDQAEGKCIALTAEYQGHPAGSVYVYRTPHSGPFREKGWPMETTRSLQRVPFQKWNPSRRITPIPACP